MPSQRYERIPNAEQEGAQPVPSSPPPSFRSRSASPSHGQQLLRRSTTDVDPTLEDTFDVRSDNEDDDAEDDRQRLMHDSASATNGQNSPTARSYPSTIASTRAVNMTSHESSNDGVFANLNAKPEFGEKTEEQPPSYEQAAADATPPYWETTILAPGMMSDEVFIDGLPVGSVFSFAWNGMISTAFQLVGFLLTYLLHTTHAARNGSRAGLGVTLISWGFQMKRYADNKGGDGDGPGGPYGSPPDPNSHDFDPNAVAGGAVRIAVRAAEEGDGGAATSWLAYAVMILGWIVLIKAVTDFVKARRHEQLILQSPDRGLNVPVVAEGEVMESVV